jgi:hypothetical protein
MAEALGMAFVRVTDLAIGVLLGWLWCSARASRHVDRRDRFEQNEELLRVIYAILRQSRQYTDQTRRSSRKEPQEP